MAPAERLDLAEGYPKRWDVAAHLAAAGLRQAGDSLRRWVEQCWPGAAWRQEWPMRRRLAGHSIGLDDN